RAAGGGPCRGARSTADGCARLARAPARDPGEVRRRAHRARPPRRARRAPRRGAAPLRSSGRARSGAARRNRGGPRADRGLAVMRLAWSRAIVLLFWFATAAYCLLSAIPFASEQFLKPGLAPALAVFARWHPWFSLAALAATAAVLAPPLRAGHRG